MATKFENYTTGDTEAICCYDNHWQAQTFTPSRSHKITYVKLNVNKYPAGSPGDVTISIRATDADGKPTGADLASVTVNGNSWQETGTWETITFDSSCVLKAGLMYAIIMRAPAGSLGNSACWRDDATGAYTGGRFRNSSDSGSTWGAAYADRDFMFEEWGNPITYPSDPVARVSSIRHIYQLGSVRMQVTVGALGFDTDVAEATVRSSLDTAKEVEEAPPEVAVTKPPEETYEQKYQRLYGKPPAEMRAAPPSTLPPPGPAELTDYAKRILEKREPAIELLQQRAKARELGVAEVSERTIEIFMREPEKIAVLQEIHKLNRSAQAPGITDYARQVLRKRVAELQSKLTTLYRSK